MKTGANCLVGPNVKVGRDVHLEDNVVLYGDITIGDGTHIYTGCTIRGTVRVGCNNHIFPYCVVGTGPQHTEFADSQAGTIQIGDDNTIREFTTIHLPTVHTTSIGSGCYIMAYAHIAHDTDMHNAVILATRTTLAGHCTIEPHAYVGQGSSIHQYCRIGQYTMIGMNSSIIRDVPPFALMNRQVFTKINRVGLERGGISSADIHGIEQSYRRHGLNPPGQTWYEEVIREFAINSTRGAYQPAL